MEIHMVREKSGLALPFVIALLASTSGCGQSSQDAQATEGASSSPRAQADSATDAGHPDFKEFAKRYNALASDKFKIVQISDNGRRGEEFKQMDLEAPHQWMAYHLRNGSVAFLPGSYDTNPTPTEGVQLCAWIVRSLNPTISESAAVAFVTSAFSQQYNTVRQFNLVIRHNYDGQSDCTVTNNGL